MFLIYCFEKNTEKKGWQKSKLRRLSTTKPFKSRRKRFQIEIQLR